MSSSVLVVCTGNICRSPLGERLLARNLAQAGLEIAVSSAGTHALVGGVVPTEVSSYANFQQSSVDGHQPRQLTEEMIEQSDLILTAERAHRSEVVSLVPRASTKTFTIKQFARLATEHEVLIEKGDLASLQISDLRELVAEIADFRSLATPLDNLSDDDVADPYKRSQTAYDTANNEINEAQRAISNFFARYLAQ